MNSHSPIVDLTSSARSTRPTRPFPIRLSSSPQQATGHYASSPSSSSTPHRGRELLRGVKRRRLSSDSGSRASAPSALAQPEDDEDFVEAIDLTGVDGSVSLAKALAKQREDAVKAQQSFEHEKGRSVLASYNCPVCMDTPEDATSTACGHLFCHKCIIDCLKNSEEQRADSSGKAQRGTCPVCRKPLTRNEAAGPRRSLIPLQLKLMTKKRSAATPAEA
ncbi:uncharacterized protein PFLUO_LOCUS4988 [Penicillium psychrofluorescens]|uniref:uncharacterized protein n=1 Tax=Penicillium psychrofluorescens TaxID=3158075 RepID=UPI003CCCE149